MALATALMDLQKWEEAEQALQRASRLIRDPKALFALGGIYWRQTKNLEAEKELKEGLRLEPRSARSRSACLLADRFRDQNQQEAR
jgi:tetratricopeptide (TPR) repeat protein